MGCRKSLLKEDDCREVDDSDREKTVEGVAEADKNENTGTTEASKVEL